MTLDLAAPRARLSWLQLWILLLARLIFNTAFRIVYPLLALLASGFGVSLQTASLLITVQVAAALLSPLGGALTDARGERAAMTVGLGLFTLGTGVCAAAGSFWLFLFGYGLTGLGLALFAPAVQAYASNRSSYGERGRVLGFLELSWALAALVGVAGLTQLVELQGSLWGAFGVLSASGAIMLVLTRVLLDPHDSPRLAKDDGPRATPSEARRPLWTALQDHGVAAVLAFVALQICAGELIFVSYAAWLEQDFGASTRSLGLVFGLLGIAELGGSIGATLFTDRVGKRRAVLFGFLATGLVMLALPATAGRWALFIGLFLLFDLCFEFAIVSVFPLVSGLGGKARGTVLALTVAATGLGRIVGSIVGPRLFESYGFLANGLVAGATALAGVALGVALVREGEHQERDGEA
jgi:predicted MFS family arabinose efflux permease